MLIRQSLVINDKDFIKTFAISLKSQYSDWAEAYILDKLEKSIDIEYAVENHYYIINQANQKYSEAYDPAEFGRIYTETDEIVSDYGESPSPAPIDPEIQQKAEAWDELTGGANDEQV